MKYNYKRILAKASAEVTAGNPEFACVLNELNEALKYMRDIEDSALTFSPPQKTDFGFQFDTSIGSIQVRIAKVCVSDVDSHGHHCTRGIDNIFLKVVQDGRMIIARQLDMELTQKQTGEFYYDPNYKEHLFKPIPPREKIKEYTRDEDFAGFVFALHKHALALKAMMPIYLSGDRIVPKEAAKPTAG